MCIDLNRDDNQIISDLVNELSKTRAQVEALKAEVPEGCTPADARVLREANHGFAIENAKLRAQIEALKALLNEAATKMHEEVIKEFPSDLLIYPDIKRKHDLEMNLINQIYAALREGE